jgi:hypothetical protein
VEYDYFLQLTSGNVSLYAKKRKTFREAKKPQGYADAVAAKYIDLADEIYLGTSTALVVTKLPKKKELPSYFEGKETEIASFMKKERISTNKVKDLIELINYYNSL